MNILFIEYKNVFLKLLWMIKRNLSHNSQKNWFALILISLKSSVFNNVRVRISVTCFSKYNTLSVSQGLISMIITIPNMFFFLFFLFFFEIFVVLILVLLSSENFIYLENRNNKTGMTILRSMYGTKYSRMDQAKFVEDSL